MLIQAGLIAKVLDTAGMADCNANTLPATLERLGPDKDGEPMNESWEYASIIGMLMYLANNTRPDKFSRLPRLTPRNVHIAVPYHWFRSKVEQLEISVEPIKLNQQLADQFTKPLTTDKFLKARKELMGR